MNYGEQPLWATSLLRLRKHALGDTKPYYWCGNGRIKRITSKHRNHIVLWWELSNFALVKKVKEVKFKRPFFEELNYSNQLEF
jgi:hypothetical protein